MGYCYDHDGRLCCDICSRSGGVRRHKCPFGWCPPIAVCPECRSEHKHLFTKAHHRKNGCEVRSEIFNRQQRSRQVLIEQGYYVRCAALRVDDQVHVLFQGKDGTIGRYMPESVYYSIPMGGPVARPEDYALMNPDATISPAPNTFEGGKTTKRVA